MNLILVGASAGLGRALADELAKAGHNLLLVASNAEILDIQANELRTKYSVKVEYSTLRVKCDSASVDKVVSSAETLGEINGLLFPMGFSCNDDDGLLGADGIDRIIESNLSGIIAITSAFLEKMLNRGDGVLVFFGSVAAERGRSSNIAYSAAKRGLQSFSESIRHRCANSNIKVQFYQLGYLNTAQTAGKKLPFPAAEPEQAANHIVANLDKSIGIAYFPWFWSFICIALRLTPWAIFKTLKF